MLSPKRFHSLSWPSLPRVIICLAFILPVVFLSRQKIGHAEDWDEEYIQSLPDQSFAVINKLPDGTIIRLLPHHDAKGNLVIQKLMESINQVFQLDPRYREIAREHLLKDYYESVFPHLMEIQERP